MMKTLRRFSFAAVGGVLAILMAFLLTGCQHRDTTEYSLDAETFDSQAMEKIQTESGIDLPEGSVGLSFYHIPPVDPIVFARIRIPEEEVESLNRQLSTLDEDSFPPGFASDRCDWWPPDPGIVSLTRRTFSNGYHVELHLAREDGAEEGRTVLYLMYFTI